MQAKNYAPPMLVTKPALPPHIASINGVALHSHDELLPLEELRQRACTELLRQAAQDVGLLDARDVAASDGTTSEAATSAIEALLEIAFPQPDPSDEACERYYAAHQATYRTGERVHVRHILFAVRPEEDAKAT